MADIGKAWPVLIVCGGILPLFLSVIWLMMIRHFVAERPSVVSKDRLSVVPHLGLRCMSIYQCGGEGTYKRHSNTQVRVKLRAINDR